MTKAGFDAMFALKRACPNCPFRREGAIELEPGRVAGIVRDLLADDYGTFLCHKTVHSHLGGEWTDNNEYEASGKEGHCFGAMVALYKDGRPSVGMRIALITGKLTIAELERHGEEIMSATEALQSDVIRKKGKKDGKKRRDGRA